MTQKNSPAYPNFPLEKAIALATQIFDRDRKNPIDRAVAARHIGYSGPSGAADKSLATLSHYGLVERAGKGQLRVTQTLVDIIHPDSGFDRRDALVVAGMSPAVFQEIRSKFDDGIPSEGALKSWLVRENFLDRAIAPVARAYLETMRYLEQSRALESDVASSRGRAELADSSENAEPKQPHTIAQVPPTPIMSTPYMELNRINAQIQGDTVQIFALLDQDGLEKLERKIAALKDLLSE